VHVPSANFPGVLTENLSTDFALRLQDNLPWPDKGFAAAAELAFTWRL